MNEITGSDTPVPEAQQVKPEEEEANLRQIQKDMFDRNQECAKWLPEIKKREREYQLESPKWKAEVQEVFYSPKTNSCLYITHVNYGGSFLSSRYLMDVSFEIGTDPIMGCDFVSDLVVYMEAEKNENQRQASGEIDEYSRMTGLKMKQKMEKECSNFDSKIRDEYKNYK